MTKELRDAFTRLEQRFDRVEQKLFIGNGDKPLCQTVSENSARLSRIEKKPKHIFKIIVSLAIILQTVFLILSQIGG